MISVCYTSAHPTLVPSRVQEWINNAVDVESIEFVVTIDAVLSSHYDSLTNLPRAKVFLNAGRPCSVDGWNLAARKARGDILIQCSDDLHAPVRWDADVRNRLSNGDTKAVLAISDGLTASPAFLPYAIMTRQYYNDFGYMFHDAYCSTGSDNEFSVVAHRSNAVIDARDIRFIRSHGKAHDNEQARNQNSQRAATGRSAFQFRQQNDFQPWKFDTFMTDDGDSDGIYSPNWRSRLASYWNESHKTPGYYLELHRESLNRRLRLFGSSSPVEDLQVLIPTLPQRREFLDLLTAELARQGISFLLDERSGLSVGDKRNELLARSTAPYVTFIDDDDWVSHNYAEVITDVIVNNRYEMDAVLYDVLITINDKMPRGSFLSFDIGRRDLPDCYVRLPHHLMVWKRDIARKERFKSTSKGEDVDWSDRMNHHEFLWARVHALLYFYEYLHSNTTTQR